VRVYSWKFVTIPRATAQSSILLQYGRRAPTCCVRILCGRYIPVRSFGQIINRLEKNSLYIYMKWNEIAFRVGGFFFSFFFLIGNLTTRRPNIKTGQTVVVLRTPFILLTVIMVLHFLYIIFLNDWRSRLSPRRIFVRPAFIRFYINTRTLWGSVLSTSYPTRCCSSKNFFGKRAHAYNNVH